MVFSLNLGNLVHVGDIIFVAVFVDNSSKVIKIVSSIFYKNPFKDF